MKNKFKYSVGGLFNFTKDSYLERTNRPVYALVFLLPFIIFYELGTLFINTDVLNQSQIRVVAFVWLQQFLQWVGFGSRVAWMAPALAVVVILLALQLASRKSWKVWIADICPMAIECSLLAVPLIVFSLVLNDSAPRQAVIQAVVSGLQTIQGPGLMTNIVTGIGAGIYEELIFRLVLICFFMIIFDDLLRLGRRNSIIISVLLSAALFSAHHHIVFVNGHLALGAPFNLTEFTFRTIAGIYFAVLFAVRGFGITAGTHAFYDIIATVINTAFFQ